MVTQQLHHILAPVFPTMRRSEQQLFRDRGSVLNKVRQKQMSVPVDPEEGPHFGNDGLASSLMSDYVKDQSEVPASSCELRQLLLDKEILDEDLQDCWDDWAVTLTREDRMMLSLVFQAFQSLLCLVFRF